MCFALALGACTGNMPTADVPQESNDALPDEGSESGVGDEREARKVKVSPQEAMQMMSEANSYLLLDVRTEEEYLEIRIEGSLLVPDYEVRARIEAEVPNKDELVLVYCRSGRRSAEAAETMLELGYTNVYDMGGIIDWPYETTSGP